MARLKMRCPGMTNSNKTSAAVAFADNMGDDEHEEGENV